MPLNRDRERQQGEGGGVTMTNGRHVRPRNPHFPKPEGRTQYMPEYAEAIRQEMAKGYSFTAACGVFGLRPDNVRRWQGRFEDLDDAVEIGKAQRVLHWEKQLMTAPDGPTVSKSLAALRAAAPDEWREKTEITGPNGGPVQLEAIDTLEAARRIAFALEIGRRAAPPVIEHEPLKSDAAE